MSGRDPFETWATNPLAPTSRGLQIGELVALADEGTTAIVNDPLQPGGCALMQARTVVDLHAGHIGQQVLLAFVPGAAERPVVLGVLRGNHQPTLAQGADPLSIDADGARLVVEARQQLVLRCGKASITLTKAGKVLIEGAYVLSRSTGANRIEGASVQLN